MKEGFARVDPRGRPGVNGGAQARAPKSFSPLVTPGTAFYAAADSFQGGGGMF
jgi:hypothetical protein